MNILAKIDGPEANGNNKDCMYSRGGMRCMGAAQTKGVIQVGGVAQAEDMWAGDTLGRC